MSERRRYREGVARAGLRYGLRPWLGPRVPVRVQRAVFESAGRPLPGVRVDVSRVRLGGVPAELIRPANAVPDLTVLYLHGGGYVVGSPRAFRALTSRLARTAAAEVLALDYRRAPEYPFPAARDDAISAYGALLNSGVDPGAIAIAGDSAGGGLTLACAVELREQGLPLPRALLLISPWLDLRLVDPAVGAHAQIDPVLSPAGLRRWARLYLNGRDPGDPGGSPLLADLRGLPPILVQVGSDEILLGDSQRLAASPGVQVTLEHHPGLWHDFQVFGAVLPAAREAMDRAATFLKSTPAPAGAEAVP
jgi:monoterpene epsilon-lactone hydrolase